MKCVNVLDKILEHEYGVVYSPELLTEWKPRQSRYYRRWFAGVMARNLQIPLSEDDVFNSKLRDDIEAHAETYKDREEMIHDVHLLAAALASDERILSMNKDDRKRFKAICVNIAEIRAIIWVNPDKPDEKCIDWLDNDAPADDFRKLGYQAED